MKFLTSLLFISISISSYAQSSVCQKTYVWDFCRDDGKKVTLTENFTREFEEELTKRKCTVLQRRNYGNLAAQEENEKAIHSLKDSSPNIEQSLKEIKAESVVFGSVSLDSYHDIYSVHVSIEHLETKQILKSHTLLITKSDADQGELRKRAVHEAVDSLLKEAIKIEEYNENIGFRENSFPLMSINSVVLSDEDSYKINMDYGKSQWRSENYQHAINFYQKALTFKPNDSLAIARIVVCKENLFQTLKNQGDKYFHQEQWEPAYQNYKLALSYKTDDPHVQSRIDSCQQKKYEIAIAHAENYLNQENYEASMKSYSTALEIKPGDAYAQNRVDVCKQSKYESIVEQANNYFEQKNWEDALKIYFTALDIKSTDSNILNQLELFQQKNLIANPTTNAQIAHRLGTFFYQHGNFVKASNQFRKGLEFDPNDAQCKADLTNSNWKILSSKSEVQLRVICSGGVFKFEIPVENEELVGMTVKLTDTETGNAGWATLGDDEEIYISSFNPNKKYVLMLLGSTGQNLFSNSFAVSSNEESIVNLILEKP